MQMTQLSCCVDTMQSNNIDKVINEELNTVKYWLVTNKFSLNFNKTKYMQFMKLLNMFLIYICKLTIMKYHV